MKVIYEIILTRLKVIPHIISQNTAAMSEFVSQLVLLFSAPFQYTEWVRVSTQRYRTVYHWVVMSALSLFFSFSSDVRAVCCCTDTQSKGCSQCLLSACSHFWVVAELLWLKTDSFKHLAQSSDESRQERQGALTRACCPVSIVVRFMQEITDTLMSLDLILIYWNVEMAYETNPFWSRLVICWHSVTNPSCQRLQCSVSNWSTKACLPFVSYLTHMVWVSLVKFRQRQQVGWVKWFEGHVCDPALNSDLHPSWNFLTFKNATRWGLPPVEPLCILARCQRVPWAPGWDVEGCDKTSISDNMGIRRDYSDIKFQ